tara:strand:- start:1231 stop:1428 length:198 start_codon:yes stop_codon:yes gene_type:complete
MLKIKVNKGEKIESAIKRLKRKFRDTGILKQVRERQEYTKPSVTRRKQVQKAKYIQKLRDQESNS